jgi:hypothetical protein
VNRLSEHFFSRATFAHQQDRDIPDCGASSSADGVSDGTTITDNIFESLDFCGRQCSEMLQVHVRIAKDFRDHINQIKWHGGDP